MDDVIKTLETELHLFLTYLLVYHDSQISRLQEASHLLSYIPLIWWNYRLDYLLHKYTVVQESESWTGEEEIIAQLFSGVFGSFTE